jgi:Asp-tRNA(Asn)/Glu-tRNA(Gln) amidotransferase C subunit
MESNAQFKHHVLALSKISILEIKESKNKKFMKRIKKILNINK